ncbi:nuclear transport factor 2 family protein [Celeribacter baekdonensis]|jgi:ketosteroid isomerase-like protein|uniref:Nuclear transport factor 2 family protein n=1 Tax=Celeribacter baekdonensis TaxID=875171 RepID=A0A2R4M5H8_9RHOB|nr:nuclear transport factor 2 family protein [Celeribacter baekdonensis]AVW92423.1 nuclear transport factor 2 family protein [Celeribacter baekdonensis]|tara:strand:+ start:51264 stop:51830 length:567 start_codon:yes stop_codon:yes gene_type:complete
MTDSDTIAALTKRLELLEAEAEVRRVQSRYMFLCDTPMPEYGVKDDAERIDLIMELFSEEAVWEGVGEYYTGQFGRAEGKAAVRKHFEGFWGGKTDPALILNCHYLTSEQINVAPDGLTATGQWVHMQPWLFSDGKALLRSSRLFNAFKKCDDGTWRYTRNRTENVFVAPLPATWASDYPSASVLMKP